MEMPDSANSCNCRICAETKLVAQHEVDPWINVLIFQIDIAFEEDRGFLAAIVALTQVAKRPIILTSNDPNITLPTDSEFLTLKFKPLKMEVGKFLCTPLL